MEWIVSLISDLVIILFDIVLYIRLTPFKKENWITYTCVGVGASAIVTAYTLATYLYDVPYSIASFLCMTLPSLILFFILSKYKNARFIVTFCFVDTTTLVIAALSKTATLLGGMTGALVSLGIVLIICVAILIVVWPYCSKYKALLEKVEKGFNIMAVSCVLIYGLLVFAAAYPKPLLERTEYLFTYLAICATVLSFYAVFIVLIKEKAKLIVANDQLKLQQHWKQMAYMDELTQLANKAAYDDLVEKLEKSRPTDVNYYVILFDIDSLKYVNDHFGHLEGDRALKDVASVFKDTFKGNNYNLFRIGGDEFVALCRNIDEEEIKTNVKSINERDANPKYGYSCSCGYACVDFSLTCPFKESLNKADQEMYLIKASKKNRK